MMTEIKNPIIAAILSFLAPGWGQVYNGQGILKSLLYVIGIMIGSVILVIPGVIIYIYGIYDAFSVAKKINQGLLPAGKDVSLMTHILFLVAYFVVAIAAILVIAGIIFGMVLLFTFLFSYSSY